jgi:hypothetical protein
MGTWGKGFARDPDDARDPSDPRDLGDLSDPRPRYS